MDVYGYLEAESDRTTCNFVERLSAHACNFLEADKYINVDKLETEVKKLTKEIKEKAGLDALNKLDTKVNRLNTGTRT